MDISEGFRLFFLHLQWEGLQLVNVCCCSHVYSRALICVYMLYTKKISFTHPHVVSNTYKFILWNAKGETLNNVFVFFIQLQWMVIEALNLKKVDIKIYEKERKKMNQEVSELFFWTGFCQWIGWVSSLVWMIHLWIHSWIHQWRGRS